jgi:protein TonB
MRSGRLLFQAGWRIAKRSGRLLLEVRKMAKRERFHPDSPVQRDRASPVPFIVTALLLAAIAWQARESWTDALAPPYVEPADHERPTSVRHNQPTRAQSARSTLLALFTSDDYPVDALRRNEQGTVATRLRIDSNGRVSGCTIVASSGSRSLDDATCKILTERARFSPARDAEGEAVPDTYDQRVTWQLQ